MSDPQQTPWSNNPNAPNITSLLYSFEKASFAGLLITSVLHGTLIVLFFKCMVALLNPVSCRGAPIKWGLTSYTVVMFLLAIVGAAMSLDILSISYIDNREFPGAEGVIFPGPLGYQLFISPEALSIIPNVMLTLSNWLADGLLLYRCYVIYSMNLWVIAFPCVMYIGSVAMGITVVYQNMHPTREVWSVLPYFSISLSLNILLTLMIVVRLILHTRNIRTAVGIAGIGGLCKAIITMFIESCALYAVNSVLFIGPWGVGNATENTFLPMLTQTQVIAPLLIIQRVANKSALTSNTVVSGRLRAGDQGMSMGGGGTLPNGDPTSSVDEHRMSSDECAVEVENTADFHQNKA